MAVRRSRGAAQLAVARKSALRPPADASTAACPHSAAPGATAACRKRKAVSSGSKGLLESGDGSNAAEAAAVAAHAAASDTRGAPGEGPSLASGEESECVSDDDATALVFALPEPAFAPLDPTSLRFPFCASGGRPRAVALAPLSPAAARSRCTVVDHLIHAATQAGLSDESLALGVTLWDHAREGSPPPPSSKPSATHQLHRLMGPAMAALWVAAKMQERRCGSVVTHLPEAIIQNAVFRHSPYSRAALLSDELALLHATAFLVHRPTAPPFAMAILDAVAAAAATPPPLQPVASLALLLCCAALRSAPLSAQSAAVTGAAAAALACKAFKVSHEKVVLAFSGVTRSALRTAMAALLTAGMELAAQPRDFLGGRLCGGTDASAAFAALARLAQEQARRA